jgi:hypothetical protein
MCSPCRTMWGIDVILRALLLMLLVPTLAQARPATAKQADCKFLRECMSADGFCVIQQLPQRGRAAFVRSEAYGDAMARVADLQARRGDVRAQSFTRDPARMLSGLGRSSGARTLFIGRGGRAVETPGLFVDDLMPVQRYFDSAEPLLEGMTKRQVALAGACCP